MQIIVLTKKLQEAVRIIERVVGRNLSLPIAQGILLETHQEQFRLRGTNFELATSAMLGAKIEEEGAIVAPARILSEFTSVLHEEKTSITTKGSVLHIKADRYHTKINGFNAKDFPPIPEIKKEANAICSGYNLHRAFNSVSDSIASSETRPELSGVFVRLIDGKIVCAATDGFRLSEIKIPAEKINQPGIFILPKQTLLEVSRIASDNPEELVSILLEENQIQFNIGTIEIFSRLIDGVYPDYQKIIPQKINANTVLETPILKDVVRSARMFSGNLNDIIIKANRDEIEIYSQHLDKGELVAKLPHKLEGEPFNLTCNSTYVLDGLKNISTPQCQISYIGEMAPLVFRPTNTAEEEKNTYIYLVMPLKT